MTTTPTLLAAAAAATARRSAGLALLGLPIHLHLRLFERVEHWMHAAGYPVLFGLLFSCGLGVPLPEDVPLLFAGYFVANGDMHLVPAAVVAWCGIMAGDCCLYGIGRRYGLAVTKVPVIGSHIKADQIERLHGYFEQYGVWVVAVGRLFAGVRGAMVLVAGTIRFTFAHFIVADGLAAIVSGGLFMGLGYWAGLKFGNLKQIHAAIEHYSLYILGGLAVATAAAGAWYYWRSRRRRGAGPRPAPVAASTPGVTPIESPPLPPA